MQIDLKRRHARGPVEDVVIAWWWKEHDEFRKAVHDRNQSNISPAPFAKRLGILAFKHDRVHTGDLVGVRASNQTSIQDSQQSND